MKRLRIGVMAAIVGGMLGAPVQAQDRPTLELSLDDTVKRALENNVDIAVSKYNPELSAESVASAEGAYDPTLNSSVTRLSRTTPSTSAFAGATTPESSTFTYNFGGTKALKSGGSLDLTFDNNRFRTNNIFTNPNPQFSSTLQASLSQPLLKNLKVDALRQNLRVAKKNREISDVQFQQTVINTTATAKLLYYDLIGAIDNLEAQRKSLALAKKLLDENQIKVRVGTMAPLDVVAAESEVASREEGVILAEAAVADAEDAIKRTIFPGSDPQTWSYRIVPKDRPTAEAVTVDAQAAIANAMQKRTDVVAARKNLDVATYGIEYARNQLRPQLDVVASYSMAGVRGTSIERQVVGGLPTGPIIRTVPGGYGDALSDVFGFNFPTWNVGFNVAVPVGNRQAKAASAQARISKEQAEASLRRLELQVASEVRTAGRAVETNFKRVESTRAARVLQQRRLDAEEKRFAAGMSTNFLVTQAQRDLSLAEVAEIRAISDYRKSLVDFERVQEAGTSGITLASGSTGGGAAGRSGASGRSNQGSQQIPQ